MNITDEQRQAIAANLKAISVSLDRALQDIGQALFRCGQDMAKMLDAARHDR